MERKANCWENEKIITEVFSKILSPPVFNAAKMLKEAGQQLDHFSYTCMYVNKSKQSYKYYIEDDSYPFCFIINKNSLLFYLRGAATKNNQFSFSDLQREFTDIKENNLGEWNFKIINENQASYVIQNILKKQP